MTRYRERNDRIRDEQGGNPAPADLGGGNLAAIRREARDLITAGDDAISRALSGDSESFLRANRQQGGQ
jgi:hypothetical protein